MPDGSQMGLRLLPPGLWVAYTPILTAVTSNPTLGTGSTQVGRFTRWGRTVTGTFFIKFGTVGALPGNGQYKVSLPQPRADLMPNESIRYYGSGQITDASANLALALLIRSDPDPTVMFLKVITPAAPVASLVNVSHLIPFAWAADDVLTGNFEYEAA